MKEVSNIQLILPDGKLVLQRRDEKAGISSPGLLCFFGGHVEEGESADEAMRRELSEETSLNVSELDIIYIDSVELLHPDKADPSKIKAHFYKAEINSDDFEVYEGQGSEAYSYEELSNRQDVAPTARYMINNFII